MITSERSKALWIFCLLWVYEWNSVKFPIMDLLEDE